MLPKINISNFIRDFNLLKKTNEGETKFFEIDTENVLSFSECYIIIDKLFLKLKGMNAEEKRKEGSQGPKRKSRTMLKTFL